MSSLPVLQQPHRSQASLRPHLPLPAWALAQRWRTRIFLILLALALVVVSLLSISLGPVAIAPHEVLAVLLSNLGLSTGINSGQIASSHDAVVMAIRLPRTVLGILVGSALALAGATMQGLFRNPLADPGLIGVSAGAALAAVSLIVLGSTSLGVLNASLGPFAIPIAAFLGGMLTTLIVYHLASSNGRTQVATLLLAGIAINAIAMAGVGIFTFVADDQQLRSLTFWNLGSLSGASWPALAAASVLIVPPLFFLMRLAPGLNAFVLGEAEAGHLGFDSASLKRQAVFWVALVVGAAVGISGVIGFIGLVVPHLVRLAIGPDHRYLLPGSALLGGTLLLLADLLARTVVTPAELPIGIVTALLGGPFFIWLLLRQRQSGYF